MSDLAWIVLENIICMLCFALLAIVLPDWWRLLAFMPLAFINFYSKAKKIPQAIDAARGEGDAKV